jgi:hypothetical protein
VLPSYSLHEPGVDRTHEPQTQRELSEPCDPILQCRDVVAHLADVGRLVFRPCLHFVEEDVGETGSRTFYPRREHSLTANVRSDEEVWIGEASP